MNFLALNEFASIVITPKTVYGVKLKRVGKKIILTKQYETAGDDLAPIRVIENLKVGSNCALVISAILPQSQFFSCKTLELPAKELESALQFELPRYVPQLPSDYRFNVTTLPAEDQCQARVWLSAGKAVDDLVSILNRNNIFPDAILHPLQAVTPEMQDFSVYLPEFNQSFYWNGHGYGQCPANRQNINNSIIDYIKQQITVDASTRSIDFQKMLPALMTALYCSTISYRKNQRNLSSILPTTQRAKRYRLWLRLSAIVVSLIIVNSIALGIRSHMQYSTIYDQLTNDINSVNSKTKVLQSSLTTREKKVKEMQKVTGSEIFCTQIPNDWATFASLMPDSTVVSTLKWQDGKIRMVISSTSEENIPALLNSYKRYNMTVSGQATRNNIQQIDLTFEPNSEVSK